MVILMTYNSIFISRISEERNNLVHYRVHIFSKILRLIITQIIKFAFKNMTNITNVKLFNTTLTDNLIKKVYLLSGRVTFARGKN